MNELRDSSMACISKLSGWVVSLPRSLLPKTSNKSLKLVSHWHANSSRLFREFSRGTFARHSCECRENFHVLRTSRELVAKVLNMFKNWMRIFFPKYFARLSRDGRATVARRSRDSLETTCEKLATIWRENKT